MSASGISQQISTQTNYSFAKMFAPLGLEQDGLWIYVQFLAEETRRDLDSLLEKTLPQLEHGTLPGASMPRHRITFVDLITEILDIVAACIEQQEQFLLTEFSTGKLSDNTRVMSLVMRQLQLVCSDACGKVLDTFARVRSLGEIVQKIQLHQMHHLKTENTDLDPKHLDLLLEEMAIICARCEMYDRFANGKLEATSSLGDVRGEEVIEKVVVEEKEGSTDSEAGGSESTLSTKLNEIMMAFIPIDDFFMRQSIHKAVVINKYKGLLRREERSLIVLRDEYGGSEFVDHAGMTDREYTSTTADDYSGLYNSDSHQDEDDSSDDDAFDDGSDDEDKCTTLVDDTFFILQKSISRLLRTLNVQVICAVLNNVNTILAGTFRKELSRALGLISSRRGMIYDMRKMLEIIASLNNLDMSATYATRLKEEFEHSCEDVARNDMDREKLKSCAFEMIRAADEFRSVLKTGLTKLLSSCLLDDIIVLAQEFRFVNYNLTEAEYSQNEIQDPFIEYFIERCDDLLEPFERLMTSHNFELVVQEIVTIITQTFENILFGREVATRGHQQKRTASGDMSSTQGEDIRGNPFSQLGGLQFDKDIRKLLLYFSSKTQTTVRDKFSKLTQMANLLKMSRVYEVLDYWGENAVMTWRLTPAEVREVLRFRRDFKMEAISRLKL